MLSEKSNFKNNSLHAVKYNLIFKLLFIIKHQFLTKYILISKNILLYVSKSHANVLDADSFVFL